MIYVYPNRNPLKHCISLLEKAESNSKVKRTTEILEEKLSTTLVKFEILDEGYFSQISKSLQDKEIYKIASKKLKTNIKINLDNYPEFLLEITQSFSVKIRK